MPRLLPFSLLAASLLGVGCSRAPVAPNRPTEPGPGAEPVTAEASLYRPGDFVVYRYSGLFSETPVELRESVLSRRGARLEIEVVARRGAEERRWIQVVTDTPENREANRVDALYEVVGGRRVRLANDRNRDLFRLYEWTTITQTGPARDQREVACAQRIGDSELRCSCHEARLDWHGRSLRAVQSECPDFLWTHGPSRIWDEGSDEDAWRVDILEYGRAD